VKRRIALLVAAFLLAIAPSAHASRIYWRSVLTGSGSGALDAISKTAALQTRLVEGGPLVWVPLATGDSAVVITPGDMARFYNFDAASTAAESSPAVIAPDDAGTTGRWLQIPADPVAQNISLPLAPTDALLLSRGDTVYSVTLSNLQTYLVSGATTMGGETITMNGENVTMGGI